MEERMKKTLLAKWAIVLVALAGVLIGCEQPTEYTVTETIPSIGGPRNLKATTATGAVVLTWDLVTDAEGYEIRRKEDASGSTFAVIGDTKPTESRYVDVISDTNLLKISTKYIYQVIAVSGAATRTVGVVQSGVSETDITTTATQFPARGTAVSVVTNPKVEVASNGNVLVTWTGNANPAVQYEVTGGSNGSFLDTVGNTASDYISSGQGTYNAAIRAVLGDGIYYPPSAAAYAFAEYDVRVLSSITATISGVARESNGTKVVIQFRDVYGATGYILEKTRIGNGYSINSPVSAVWTNVLTTAKVKISDVLWQVTDTVPVDQTWLYRLIVQLATGVSSPNSSTSSVVNSVSATSNSIGLNVSRYTVTQNTATSGSDNGQIGFNVEFNSEPGATYTLWRRAYGDPNGTGSGATSEYTQIGGTIAALAFEGIKTVQNTPPLQRQKYEYKIVRLKDGVTTESDSYTISARSALQVNYVSFVTLVSSNNTQSYYSVNGVSTLLSNESIKIYGRTSTTGTTTHLPDSVLIATITASDYHAFTMTGDLAWQSAGYYFTASNNLSTSYSDFTYEYVAK
jgi:hypothetical protein